MTGKFEKSEKEPLMDSNRLERKKRIERNRKRRLYRNVNNLMYAGIFVMAAIITIAAAVSRNNKIEYVDTAQMASTELTIAIQTRLQLRLRKQPRNQRRR